MLAELPDGVGVAAAALGGVAGLLAAGGLILFLAASAKGSALTAGALVGVLPLVLALAAGVLLAAASAPSGAAGAAKGLV